MDTDVSRGLDSGRQSDLEKEKYPMVQLAMDSALSHHEAVQVWEEANAGVGLQIGL